MSAKIKAPMTGADVVVRTLKEHGVKHVIGIPGARIDSVFNALIDSSIQTVVCRHEQNAAFIAGGIGRMTGSAGVALVASGPGVANLVTGLATANSEGDPMVALGGAVGTEETLNHIHQTMDSIKICKPVTKFCASVVNSSAVSEVLSNAFRIAECGRPGAAFVSLPRNIMEEACTARPLVPPAFSGLGPADAAAVAEAGGVITRAQNPVIVLGLLANRPRNLEAVRHFVTASHLPVVGTFQSTGAVAAQLLENSGGRIGQLANQPVDALVDQADLVITVGYDPVEYHPSIWNKTGERTVIHVDVVHAALSNCYCPTIELIGDISQSLAALTPLVKRPRKSPSSVRLLEIIRSDRTRLLLDAAKMSGVPIHPLRIVYELQKLLTPDVTMCVDTGSFHLWLDRHLCNFRVRQLLISNGRQTFGVALPWAIAASLIRPHEKVISISGDGGFLFTSMELETAVRLKCNLVHMIWIDGSYDMVGVQQVAKYGRKSGVEFGPCDPVKYAAAFGAVGLMIRTANEIPLVLRKAFDTSGPVVVGVHVDYSDNYGLLEMLR
jgi:acetolactate synthase-1/2/3 large subunit